MTIAETFEVLRQLCGAWSGSGTGVFPTIKPFEYRERLCVTADIARPFLHYDQRTEQHPEGGGDFRPSHWEAGFLWVTGPCQVRLTSAHSGGRFEVCALTLTPAEGGFGLAGDATAYFNDPRMVAGHRTFELAGDELRYRLEMATAAVSPRSQHLSAVLHRDGT